MFRKNLKEARKKAGITQRELAEFIGTTANTVSNWETGTSSPDIETIPKICECLNISPNVLFSLNEHAEKELDVLNLTQGEVLAGEIVSGLHDEDTVKLLKDISLLSPNKRNVVKATTEALIPLKD